ncbi:MAG: diguanylate cyclase [Candidatus Hydrogenedentes bacterium]|nr:diguanylate cyclase [Candidatus Hydrogenedentota bacterium]
MKLGTRLSLAFFIIATVVNALVASGLFVAARYRIREEIRNRLRDAVAIAALEFDAEAHRSLREPSQESGPTYAALKKRLQAIRDNGTDFRYVYTWRPTPDGHLVFVVDAESDPEEVSHLGDPYDDAEPWLEEMLIGLEGPAVDEEFTEDSWGVWLSGYAPFYTADGAREGILGIDVEASQVLAYEHLLLAIAVGVFAVSSLVAFILGRVVGKRLAAPVVTLAESANRVAQGNWDDGVGLRASGEIGVLVAAFNQMAAEIRSTLSQLRSEIAERISVEKKLRYHQGNLEQIVAVRTEEIEREMEERRRAERLLEAARTELEQVFSCAAPLCVVDNTYTLIRANEAFRRFFELPAESRADEKCYELRRDPRCHTPTCPLRKVLEMGKRQEAETEVRLPNGKTLWFLSISTPYKNEGGETQGVVQTFLDISGRKHVEAELRRLSQCDGLTGVANRRYFDETLKMRCDHSAHNGDAISLILADVDFFKPFNDTYGHQAGDLCLRRVAGALASGTRGPDDLVARYGGEEFAVVLPGADAELARAVAERLKVHVADMGIPHGHSSASEVVTISVGVATCRAADGDISPELLVRQADSALYEAKGAGRNCVRVAG